jgi:LysR family glycine cleavage system transcriptional activator
VTITTTLAFAGLTFLSRLADFHVSYPEIDIRVIESDERLDFDVDGIDLAIRYGKGRWPGVDAIHLFDEETFPVCSPRLAEENPELRDIRSIPLFRLALLRKKVEAETSPFPRRTYPTGSVSGMPSAV